MSILNQFTSDGNPISFGSGALNGLFQSDFPETRVSELLPIGSAFINNAANSGEPGSFSPPDSTTQSIGTAPINSTPALRVKPLNFPPPSKEERLGNVNRLFEQQLGLPVTAETASSKLRDIQNLFGEQVHKLRSSFRNPSALAGGGLFRNKPGKFSSSGPTRSLQSDDDQDDFLKPLRTALSIRKNFGR
jgi:hypothetical protein